MKLSLFALLLTASTALADVAITVTTGAGTAAQFATSDGNLLPAGCVIRVGSFDTSGLNLATIQTSSSFAAVDALFTPLGEGIDPRDGTITQTGSPGTSLVVNWSTGTTQVSGQITGIDATYLTTATPLYFWVFNNSDINAATEWGIFGSSAFWTFPTEFTAPTFATRRTDVALRGDIIGTPSSSGSQLRLTSIAAVPEPASALLLSLAALVTTMRRRRA